MSVCFVAGLKLVRTAPGSSRPDSLAKVRFWVFFSRLGSLRFRKAGEAGLRIVFVLGLEFWFRKVL